MFFVELKVTDLLHNDSSSKHHTLGIVLDVGIGLTINMEMLVHVTISCKLQSVWLSSNIWYAHSGPILEDDLFNGEVFVENYMPLNGMKLLLGGHRTIKIIQQVPVGNMLLILPRRFIDRHY